MIWKNRIIKHGEEAPGLLKANPLNFRTHPAGQRFALTGSLNELGWIQDVIVNQRTGLIIDGHLRVDLALEKGEETIPVKYVDLSDDEERIALAAFDAISAKAETDDEVLAELLKGVEVKDDHLDKFMDELKKEHLKEEEDYEEAPEAQIDKAEELNKKWQVQGGDVWEIGKHRLVCGSALDDSQMGTLANGVTMDFVITDPPYGMKAVSTSGVLQKNYKGDIAGDESTETAIKFCEMIKKKNIKKMVLFGANYYSSALDDSPCWLVWDKNNGASDQMDCELAWTNLPGVTRKYIEASEKTNRYHPTQKPPGLITWIIDRYCGEQENVYDPFLGSGTTMVAAEQTGRICYGMEISPDYCAVILHRMSEMGLEPKRAD